MMLEFTPSEVTGLPAVSQIAIFPDRMELCSAGRTTTIRFLDIARWSRWDSFYRLAARLGLGVRGYPAVADRNWFHPPSRRYFRFYTDPPLTIYLANEPEETAYGETLFRHLQDVLAAGGDSTMDLGVNRRSRSAASMTPICCTPEPVWSRQVSRIGPAGPASLCPSPSPQP